MLGEQHLRRLLPGHVDYYNAESVHTQLSDSPAGPSTENRPSPDAQVVGLPARGSSLASFAPEDS